MFFYIFQFQLGAAIRVGVSGLGRVEIYIYKIM